MKLDMAYRAPDHLERLIANLYATPGFSATFSRRRLS